ncbi:MAG: hypothetical protein FJW77_06665 [Actinobacteria bacterium]|nr:hypothetical protein [Actinomycetota bacterium]
MTRPRVVVLGAGMAGLTAARRLARSCDVVVVDKGRGVGGRLATRRIGGATFDHGAQFLTTHTAEFAAAVAEWTGAGAVVPWFRGRIGPDGATDPDGHVRFRGAPTMNALAKHLAVGLDVRTGSRVTAVRHAAAGWTVTLADAGDLTADAVVVTAPVPQTLALLAAGGVDPTPHERDALHAVTYEPCLALMTVLDGPSGLDDPGAVDPASGPIDWMADNQVKGVSAVPAVTIHATPGFSHDHWDAPDDEVADALLAAAALGADPVAGARSVQRWRYARPVVEHPERCLVLDGDAPLVCAGDAFGGAKVEGAARSGAAAADAVAAALGTVSRRRAAPPGGVRGSSP